jgi:hypothetical protein
VKDLRVVPGRPNRYGAIRYVKVRVFLKDSFLTEASVMLRGRLYEHMEVKTDWPETVAELLTQV